MIAMAVLAAFALLATVLRTFVGHQSAAPVELVAVDIGPVRPFLRSDRATTIEACVVPGARIQAGGQVGRVLARPGRAVRRGTLLAEIEEPAGVRAALERARGEAAAASLAAHDLCRRSPLQDRRRDLLGDMRRDSVARTPGEDETRHRGDLNPCAQARRDVFAAIGKVGILRADLERFRVRAALAGTLTAVKIAPGDVVQAGADAAIGLAKDDCLAARVRVPAAIGSTHAIERLAPACVRLASAPGRLRCDAVVRSVTAGEDQGGRGAEIVVEFRPDERGSAAQRGAAVTVEIPLAARERATRLPGTAVMDGSRVLVFDRGSRTLIERKISVGAADDMHVEILSGLSPGERVARAPATLAIEQGREVEPIEIPR